MVLGWYTFKIVSGDHDLHPRWLPWADIVLTYIVKPYGIWIVKLRCIRHADILRRAYLCQVSDTGSPEPLVLSTTTHRWKYNFFCDGHWFHMELLMKWRYDHGYNHRHFYRVNETLDGMVSWRWKECINWYYYHWFGGGGERSCWSELVWSPFT